MTALMVSRVKECLAEHNKMLSNLHVKLSLCMATAEKDKLIAAFTLALGTGADMLALNFIGVLFI